MYLFQIKSYRPSKPGFFDSLKSLFVAKPKILGFNGLYAAYSVDNPSVELIQRINKLDPNWICFNATTGESLKTHEYLTQSEWCLKHTDDIYWNYDNVVRVVLPTARYEDKFENFILLLVLGKQINATVGKTNLNLQYPPNVRKPESSDDAFLMFSDTPANNIPRSASGYVQPAKTRRTKSRHSDDDSSHYNYNDSKDDDDCRSSSRDSDDRSSCISDD